MAARVYLEPFNRDRHLMHETMTYALHHLSETIFVGPLPRTNKRASCNILVISEEMLKFSLLKIQLNTAKMSKAYGYTYQHVGHLLHAHLPIYNHQTMVQALMLGTMQHDLIILIS